MRLSPIVRRLLKPFLARISRFTRIGSTFATVNMSAALLSAVFLFSLPASAAAEEEEEEPEIEIPAAPVAPRLPERIAAGLLDKDVTLRDGTVLSAGEELSKDI